MQEVNSLCTDRRALRAEYCIVGIPHNTAISFYVGGSSSFPPLLRETATPQLLITEVHHCVFVARSSFHTVSYPATCDVAWPKRTPPVSATTCAASTCLPVRRQQVSSWRVSDDQAPAGTCPEVSRKLYWWVIQAYLEFLTSVMMMMMVVVVAVVILVAVVVLSHSWRHNCKKVEI